MLTLHNLKPNKGATKKRKRIGRGNASGHGTYSGKGQKGQRSRSGVSNLKRIGMKSTLFSIPKSRGFISDKPKNQVVNLSDINKNFKDGDIINPKALIKKNLIKDTKTDVKILGTGKLELENIKFKDVKMSGSVKNLGLVNK